jgi:alpha-tubulin suppressor-like RCC1 family protein
MKVVQVSCGENHTLALVEMSHEVEKNVSRKLFVWGNNDKWQLGMDSGISNPTEDA